MMQTVTALVPMKGQSERVVGKNLRDFCGEPLCVRVLRVLQDCPAIRAIIVNTDSEDIAAIAASFSKSVIHERAPEICGHNVPMNAILKWDLEHDARQAGHYLQTHATNPLLTGPVIVRAVEAYFAGLPGHDSLFSVTPLQTRLYTADGKGVNHDPAVLLNTQDLPVLYEENSNIYLFSRESFTNAGDKRLGLKPAMFSMGKMEALDIDNEEDFMLAQAVFRMKRERGEIAW